MNRLCPKMPPPRETNSPGCHLGREPKRLDSYHVALTTGLASVEELSAKFEVTASTIRRDLALLN